MAADGHGSNFLVPDAVGGREVGPHFSLNPVMPVVKLCYGPSAVKSLLQALRESPWPGTQVEQPLQSGSSVHVVLWFNVVGCGVVVAAVRE